LLFDFGHKKHKKKIKKSDSKVAFLFDFFVLFVAKIKKRNFGSWFGSRMREAEVPGRDAARKGAL